MLTSCPRVASQRAIKDCCDSTPPVCLSGPPASAFSAFGATKQIFSFTFPRRAPVEPAATPLAAIIASPRGGLDTTRPFWLVQCSNGGPTIRRVTDPRPSGRPAGSEEHDPVTDETLPRVIAQRARP